MVERTSWNLRHDPAERAAFRRRAAADVRRAAAPMPRWRYLGLVWSLLAAVHDLHTMAWPDVEERSYLPVAFYWASDGLVALPVEGSPPGIRLGDRVLSLGGRTPPALARALGRYMTNTGYGMRSEACRLDLLSAHYSLSWLGAVDRRDQVPIVLENAQGKVERLDLPFVRWPDALNRLQAAKTAFEDRFIAPDGIPVTPAAFGWRVVPGRYGVFWLRSFDPSPALSRGVAAFYRAVAADGAPNVVIDLQQDPGGFTAAGEDLLTPLLVQSVKVAHAALLIDQGSFSASVELGEEFETAALGPLVGQPTGEDLDIVGAQNFSLPRTAVWYQVGVGPPTDVPGRNAEALYPNVPLPLTVRDIQRGVNAVDRWLDAGGERRAGTT